MPRYKGESWKVTMKCVVRKEVICEDCTSDEAGIDPWGYAIDERELEQIDWKVEEIEKNV